jgi:hypothetical protein
MPLISIDSGMTRFFARTMDAAFKKSVQEIKAGTELISSLDAEPILSFSNVDGFPNSKISFSHG